MNLLFFLTPKQDVLFIYEDYTLRQALERWANRRYATIPILRRNGTYVGTISEGDLLWGIKNLYAKGITSFEDVPISILARRKDYKAVAVTTGMDALMRGVLDQNFVPVVDDRNVFIGIVRRTSVLDYVYENFDHEDLVQKTGRPAVATQKYSTED